MEVRLGEGGANAKQVSGWDYKCERVGEREEGNIIYCCRTECSMCEGMGRVHSAPWPGGEG